MKIILVAVITGVVAFFAESFGPWWFGILSAFFISAIGQIEPWKAFIAGFLGLGIMWAISAGFINHHNEGILSARIGELLGGISGTTLLLVTSLTGGILGGLASISGASGMKWIIGKEKRNSNVA